MKKEHTTPWKQIVKELKIQYEASDNIKIKAENSPKKIHDVSTTFSHISCLNNIVFRILLYSSASFV